MRFKSLKYFALATILLGSTTLLARGDVGPLLDAQSKIQGEITTTDGALTKLKTDIIAAITNKQDPTGLAAEIKDTQAKLEQLQAQSASLAAQIEAFNTPELTYEDMKAIVAQLTSDISALQSEIDGFQTQIIDKAMKGEVSQELNTALQSANGTLKGLKAELAAAQEKMNSLKPALPTWSEYLENTENCQNVGAEMYRQLAALSDNKIKEKMETGKKFGFDFLLYKTTLLGGMNTQLVTNRQCSLPAQDSQLPGLLKIGGGGKKYYVSYLAWFNQYMTALMNKLIQDGKIQK